MIFDTHFQKTLVFVLIEVFFAKISIFVELFYALQRAVFFFTYIPKWGINYYSKVFQFRTSLKDLWYEPSGKDDYFPYYYFLICILIITALRNHHSQKIWIFAL